MQGGHTLRTMEHTFREIASLIKTGPIKGKDKVFLDIFDIILSCTNQSEAEEYFSEDFLLAILAFIGPDSVFNNIIFKILINVSSEKVLNKRLCDNENILIQIMNASLDEITNKNSKNADNACMLLSNITRCKSSCEQILKYISPLSDTLHRIISVFTNVGYNSSCSLHQLAMVLCNITQLTEARNIITQPNHCMLQKLIPFMNHENVIRRAGIIGVVHNCAFDSSIHSWMLSDEVEILPRLLLPIAGPEEFDTEDNDKLPIDLQFLPDTKTREPIADIRKQILETLNQLCATKFGRQFLRDHNTYIILRELHKWEEDPNVLLACENVVDILIRTEDEIGIDHFNSVEIPSDLEEKFNKELAA